MKKNINLFLFIILLTMTITGCTIPVQVVSQPTQAMPAPTYNNPDDSGAVLMATISALETHVANLPQTKDASSVKEVATETPAPAIETPTETAVPTNTATAVSGVPVVYVTSIVPYQYNYGYPYYSQGYNNYYPYNNTYNYNYGYGYGYYSPCNRATFIRDVTIPDGTRLPQNTGFVKTWRLRNDGTCTWTTEYSLVFVQGSSLNGPTSSNLPVTVTPGMTIDLSINLVTPSTDGYYDGYWMLQDNSGNRFGVGQYGTVAFWTKILVGDASYPHYYPPYPGVPY